MGGGCAAVMLSYFGILLFPVAFLCFRQVWRDFRSGAVKTRTGNRTRAKAPATFWLSLGFAGLVGLVLSVLAFAGFIQLILRAFG
jgi:hypothetical protein